MHVASNLSRSSRISWGVTSCDIMLWRICRSSLLFCAEDVTGLLCSLMYPIISSIKASELQVAGRLNSWLTKSSRLGVTTPLTVHCRLTNANISWRIISHWATNCFLFVLPMMPPALFCDLLIVCSRHISAPTAVNCPSVRFTTNFPALKLSNTDGASCASFLISSR